MHDMKSFYSLGILWKCGNQNTPTPTLNATRSKLIVGLCEIMIFRQCIKLRPRFRNIVSSTFSLQVFDAHRFIREDFFGRVERDGAAV